MVDRPAGRIDTRGKDVCATVEPNVSRMQVRTHAGSLGYEWIETYAVVP